MNEQDSKQLSWSSPTSKTEPTPKPPIVTKEPAEQAPLETTPGAVQPGKLAMWIAVGIVVGVVLAWGGTALLHRGTSSSVATTTSATGENAQPGQGSDASLTVLSPQKAGTSVSVSKALVSEPTWIVVYESRGGQPGNVLGAKLFFPDSQSGTVELLRATVAGQTYFVTKQRDNGDHRFSLKGDPLVTENGQPMWASFTAN